MTQMMVMPERRSIARQRARAMVAAPSSPEVGSSKKSTEGIVTSSIPMLTRFFCPPEMPRFSSFPTTTFCTFSRLSTCTTCCTRWSFSACGLSAGSRSIAW
mmetsp:Transcript_3270/g.6932  ORF Transcript_3270/g.6932 Transcript_3270/m.6932 type:complete len:101 (-) Transcript_3270:1099-1401(-)